MRITPIHPGFVARTRRLRSRMRLTAAVAALGLSAVAISGGAAVFSDVASVDAVTVTTATVDVGLAPTAEPLAPVSQLVPGHAAESWEIELVDASTASLAELRFGIEVTSDVPDAAVALIEARDEGFAFTLEVCPPDVRPCDDAGWQPVFAADHLGGEILWSDDARGIDVSDELEGMDDDGRFSLRLTLEFAEGAPAELMDLSVELTPYAYAEQLAP